MAELNFQHLRYFWAVAQAGSLAGAARQLHVTQSAVSVQLKKLEESIGHRLFEREGRRLVLSAEGRLALDYAQSIFTLGDEMLDALDDAASARRQTLRVGVLATLSRNFQIGLLAPMLNRDGVTVVVRSGAADDLIDRLERYELDVVLTNSLPRRREPVGWVAHRLAEQPVSLVGRPREGRPEGLAELLESEPLVVPTIESGVRAGFDALVDRLGLRPRVVAEVDDMAMLRLVTREHDGIAVLPPIVVRDELLSGALVEIRRVPELAEQFLAITGRRRQPGKLLRELLSVPAREIFEGVPGG